MNWSQSDLAEKSGLWGPTIANIENGKTTPNKDTLEKITNDKFSGHIACSTSAKSEIVVPLVVNGRTELVLDIDSAQLNSFDTTDQTYLEQLITLIRDRHYS